MQFNESIDLAIELDKNDKISAYREKFFIPKKSNGDDVIYFAGNSLGLQPKSTKEYIDRVLSEWGELAVEGHFNAKIPWMKYQDLLAELTAKIVGAKPIEVVNMNTLSVNLHLMLVSFYRPTKNRYKILIESPTFPSDHYAVQSHIKFHGYKVDDSLIEISPKPGESYIKTEDILELLNKERDSIALVLLAGINYYSGQAFEYEKITKAGHEKGCIVGFDMAHSAGNLILNLHDWDVDFAVWCTYKYMNAGPGAVAGCFVHERFANDTSIPKFWGWWGQDKATRFLMDKKFIPIPGAESWQVSNPSILLFAALHASLDMFDEVGMMRLRDKSELLTSYAEFLIENSAGSLVEIITPKDVSQRGCQLSLRIKNNGKEIHKKLNSAGVICDWREPDVIRIAPVPFYNAFQDIWNFIQILDSINKKT